MMRKSVGFALCAVLAVTGCSSSQDSSTKTVDVGHWRLSVPADFQEVPPQGTYDKAWNGHGLHIEVDGDQGEQTAAFGPLNDLAFIAQSQGMPGFESDGAEKINVPNAHDARMMRFHFTDAGVTRRGVAICATQWPYPADGVITISSDKGDLDQPTVDAILKSLSWNVSQS